MRKVSMRGSGIAQLVAISAVLLFAPLTVSTADATYDVVRSGHGTVGDYRANAVPGTVEYQGSPTEAPLHCHIKSHPPQASGLIPKLVENDLPLLALNPLSAPTQETETHLPGISAQAPIAAPPRFIFFGNFRS